MEEKSFRFVFQGNKTFHCALLVLLGFNQISEITKPERPQ